MPNNVNLMEYKKMKENKHILYIDYKNGVVSGNKKFSSTTSDNRAKVNQFIKELTKELT